jgi:hypothetical protein
MAIALVQSNGGGSAIVSVIGTAATGAVGFSNPTTTGNLLVCVAWFEASNTSNINITGSGILGVLNSAGYVWTEATTGAFENAQLGYAEGGIVQIYYIANAPSMNPSVTNTFEAACGASQTVYLEFSLYEFSGVETSSPLELVAAGADTPYAPVGYIPPTPSTPNPGSFGPIANTDLVIAAFAGDVFQGAGNISAGSGFTLGINASTAVGQTQYQLNAAPGLAAAPFSGTEPAWVCCVAAFKAASGGPFVTVTNVSPPNGPIAGGTAVTVTGTDFLSGSTVDFGGAAATSVVVVNTTTITCVTPAHAVGSVTVSVTDTDGTGSLANGYLYTEPILVVSPSTLSFGAVFGGANPVSQTVGVSNGNGGTLSWTVSSDEAWLTETPTSGTNSGTVTASVDITGLAIGTYSGHLTFSASGATGSPQIVTVTLTISSGGGGGGGGGAEYMFVYYPDGVTFVGFTPVFPPIKKQPLGLWGLQAKRADSITADGQKQSVFERVDSVTVALFPAVALSDMAQWKALESFALAGGTFFYRPNIGWLDDTGFMTCTLDSLDWTPKFESFKAFSLDMKIRQVEGTDVGS